MEYGLWFLIARYAGFKFGYIVFVVLGLNLLIARVYSQTLSAIIFNVNEIITKKYNVPM